MSEKYSAFKRNTSLGLMKTFLNCPEVIRNVIITDHQIGILEVMQRSYCNNMTAGDFKYYYNVSIQSASTQLMNLWKAGYLERREVVAKSGGMEYRYRSVIEVETDDEV